MAVHYQTSQADGWVDKGYLKRGGTVYRAIRRMESVVLPQVDGLVYVSEWARHCVLNWLPEAADVPSAVVPNFIRSTDVPDAPEHLGDLVTVGALEPNKNHHFLLEVLAAAKSAGQSLTLDLFGAGPLRRSLETSAKSLGIADQVRFRGYHPAVRDFLPGYRAYVHACKNETGPLAIIEAMAAGLPVLAANVGGSAELISEGVQGRLWSLDDPGRAAETLIDVLGSETKYRNFASAARNHFEQRFEAANVCPRLLSFVFSGEVPALHDAVPPAVDHATNGPGMPGRSSQIARLRLLSPRRGSPYHGAGSPGPAMLLDGMAILRGGRGVARALRHVLPLLVDECRESECIIITSQEGLELLGPHVGRVVVVPWMPKTLWEQFGLPWYARKLGVSVIYSLAECGPAWGPPIVLNVPEDPYIRWAGAPAVGYREHLRRFYQRTMMRTSLRRALVLVTCSSAIAVNLRARFGDTLPKVRVVPLGVDSALFYPDHRPASDDEVFHLGSDEARDQSIVLVNAYAKALQLVPDLPDLVIAGNLGGRSQLVTHAAEEIGVGDRVRLLGRISDEELRSRYAHASLCVQPAKYEGFGLQPLEALACGAPLIVFTEPAVEEVVGDAAIVVSERTEVALADAIAKLWADRELRDSLRCAGPKRAQEFPWAATAYELHKLLCPSPDGQLLFGPKRMSSATAAEPPV
jgi:glycosyltransferase involved in cell wall biosynthesis